MSPVVLKQKSSLAGNVRGEGVHRNRVDIAGGLLVLQAEPLAMLAVKR